MRILISSRNTIIPNGIQQTLSLTEHHLQTNYYQSADQLVSKAILERTDLVFLDKSDIETFTFEEIVYIQSKLPRLKLIVISMIDFLDHMQLCYTGGIHGYLTYDCSAEEMEESISAVEKDRQYYCQKILTLLLPRLTGAPVSRQTRSLTDRELEIAQLISAGNTNKMIGELLCISPHTVHTHRKSLMKKLGVSSAREVTLYMLSQSETDTTLNRV